VQLHTSQEINELILRQTEAAVQRYKHCDEETIAARIEELNKEWDTERVLETNASAIILISTILGFVFSPYWFILVGFIAFFLLQHAVQGWCPPLPIIRRLGIRTASEIAYEKTSLESLKQSNF
jgi:hypothetical protein